MFAGARRSRPRGLGFTLIELLVVIIIMAVIVAVLLPTLSRARRQAISAKYASEARETANSQVDLAAPGAGPASPAPEPHVIAPPPRRPLARVQSFAADVTLTPRLSVGTIEPESIYEVKFAATLSASRDASSANPGDCELRLPIPPQIISLGDLAVTVNGEPSESVALDGDHLVWHGPLPEGSPVPMSIEYTAVGRGLYALQTPPSKILDRFQLNLTANGSDVRILHLSMQPTVVSRQSNATTYTWDYPRLMFGRPIVLDVLGIAPIDRLGELSWLGPLSVIIFGLILGLVARAYDVARIDRWMLLMVIGTFTGAFPLMYFAQEFMGLTAAMLASAGTVLFVIAARTLSIMGVRLGLAGAVLPAALIMTITLIAAVRPQLQGILLTGMALGLFLVAMTLAPRLGMSRPTLPAGAGPEPMPA
ncbi:MAG TPA: prepilin-type N-terminal cleavage/methylation domain-containing protein [Tepidisphaeraceae bacterium]|nr:prepilin-type N-terminal cleavage/methylation domain-containing protein [Tepidisphaeraceae bacterium]